MLFKRNETVYGNEEVRPFVLNRYRKMRTNGFSEEEIANCIILNAAERKVLEKEFDIFDETKSDILNALDTFDINEVPVEVNDDDKPSDKEVNNYVPKKKSSLDEAMEKLEQLEKVVCKYMKTAEPTKKESKPEAKKEVVKPEAKKENKPEAKKEVVKPEAKKENKPQAKPEVVSNFNATDTIRKQLEKAKENKPQAKPEVVSNFNATDIIRKQLEKAKENKPEVKKEVVKSEAKKEIAKPAEEAKKEVVKPEAKKESKPEAKKEVVKPEAKKETKPEYKNESIDGVDYVYLPIGEDEMQNLVEDIKENYEDLYDVNLNADKLEKCIVNILADTHILDDANTYLELFNATLSKMDELIDSNTVELGNAAEEDELLKNLNSIFED